jgi:isocitrate dehydrogenase kinase/phosphatase
MTECSLDQFEISRGERGMVMIVFNMPRDDIVFKLIRDHFATPKKSTRQDVMDKYDLVFKHDRADLFSVDFWQQTQAAIEAGELTHIYPYERSTT